MDNNIPNTVSENERIKTLKDAEPEILSYKNVKLDYSEKPKDSRKKVEIILLLVIIGIFVSALVLYEKNNKNILRKGISEIVSKIEEPFFSVKGSDILQYSIKKEFKTSIITSFQTTFEKDLIDENELKFLQNIKDVTIATTLDFNYPNKKAMYLFKSTNDGSNILEVNGNITDSNITYKIKNVLGKYISVPLDGLEHLFISKQEDQKNFNEIKNIVLKHLYSEIKEKDLERKSTVLKEFNTKVIDVEYNINDSKLKEIISNTIDDLLKDDKFIEKTSIYTDLTKTRLKEKLTDLKLYLLNNSILEKDITFNIYVKGFQHKFVGFKFEIGDLSVYYIADNKNTILKISNEDGEIITYNSEKQNNDEYEIKIKYKDNLITANKIVKNTSILYDYEAKFNNNNYEGSIVLSEEEKSSKDGNIRILLSKLNKEKENIWNISSTISYNVKNSSGMTLYEDEEAVEINKETWDEIVKRTLNNENLKNLKDSFNSFLEVQKN